MDKRFILLSLALFSIAGCSDALYPPTVKPDYTIHVIPTDKGMTAIPPACPTWAEAATDPYDNQPIPQFGCANARNLAIMTDRPSDLIKGRDGGDSSGVMAVGAMRRYYNNQTRGLLDTDTSPDTAAAITTAPTPSSAMTGDVTGSAAPSAAAPAAAAAP